MIQSCWVGNAKEQAALLAGRNTMTYNMHGTMHGTQLILHLQAEHVLLNSRLQFSRAQYSEARSQHHAWHVTTRKLPSRLDMGYLGGTLTGLNSMKHAAGTTHGMQTLPFTYCRLDMAYDESRGHCDRTRHYEACNWHNAWNANHSICLLQAGHGI